jgi:hypothetical protein
MNSLQDDQLKNLDNFQRANFLRLLRSHAVICGVIADLRRKMQVLHEKRQIDRAYFKKIETIFIGLIFSLLFLSWILSISIQIKFGAFFSVVLIFAVFIIYKKIHLGRDEILSEAYVLEIISYEAELQMMGLVERYDQDADLFRNILASLGFDDGLIGGASRVWPLEPAR